MGTKLGKRLREARQLRGMSQSELARRIGMSMSQVSRIETEGSETSWPRTIAMARTLDVSLDFLAGLAEAPAPAAELAATVRAQETRIFHMEREHAAATAMGYVEVMESRREASPEGSARDKAVKAMTLHPVGLLREQGLDPAECRVMWITNSAMQPTLPKDRRIVVNLQKAERRHDRIFVVEVDERRLVRRIVQQGTDGWMLACDNPNKTAYPTVAWPEGATVIGEVHWLAPLKSITSRLRTGESD